MKKFVLSLFTLGVAITSQAQILDSLIGEAQSVQYEILAQSEFEDFSASKYGDQLLFVSSRETKLFSRKFKYNKQKFFDLFLYDFKSKEVSRYGDQLASLEESKYHLGPATLLPDSAGIVMSRNYNDLNSNNEVNFYLIYENWKTGELTNLPFCSVDISFQHPFFDAKSGRLYFSSNLKGGQGGYDIYFSELLEDGSWGNPIIAEGVNGPSDDVFPTVAQDGTLYFSRSVDQRGLDIFAYEKGSVQSLNSPLITSNDEFSLIELNKDSVVFSQSQSGQFNTDLVLAWIETDGLEKIEEQNLTVYLTVSEDMDPWEFADEIRSKWPENEIWVGEKDGELVVVVQGPRSKEESLNTKDQLATIDYEAVLTTEPINKVSQPLNNKDDAPPMTDIEGAFCTIAGVFDDRERAQSQLEKVKKWSPNAFLSYRNGKYFVVSSSYGTKEKAQIGLNEAKENGITTAWLLPEKLTPTPLKVLQGTPDLVIYFKFDQIEVQGKYEKQIDEVITQLPENVGNVYVIGHTDARGNNDYNDELSLKRAEEVTGYISGQQRGLNANYAIDAFGERELINECSDGKDCDEYAHFLNRRVEIWFY